MNTKAFNQQEVLYLARKYTGLPFVMVEPCILLNDDLIAMSNFLSSPDSVYYGNFVLQSYSQSDCIVTAYLNKSLSPGESQIYIQPQDGLYPKGSIIKNVLFDCIGSYSDAYSHFYGYRVMRNMVYAPLTNYGFTNGNGWQLSSGTYTHQPGFSVEQTISSPEINNYTSIKLTITLTGINAGTLEIRGSLTGGIIISEDGTYTYELSPQPGEYAIYFYPSTDFDGSYNVSSLIIQKKIDA